ncbi:MAG: HD domain-containing protein [Lachnospiraceae bacterium]|nr:HD domain-containing protein [Lachnospiraceae bacterium]
MKYIQELQDGNSIREIYYCKQKNNAVTKNGREHWNVVLQDKTGTIEAKVWDLNSPSIVDFESGDYVQIYGEVSLYNNALQITIKQSRIAKEGEYDPLNYFPVTSKNVDEMWQQLVSYIGSVKNPFLSALLKKIFLQDASFAEIFKKSSAAKSVHHAFIGGLLEHTLSVTDNCEYIAGKYPVIKRDLLITAALLHDIGKTKEFAPFPVNDYTDDGNLLGHIVIGTQMVEKAASEIPDFPATLKSELEHCILAHHGKLEYGSPKVPALVEAVALNFADDMDAKLEIFTEISDHTVSKDWLGYNRFFDTNIRLTKGE